MPPLCGQHGESATRAGFSRRAACGEARPRLDAVDRWVRGSAWGEWQVRRGRYVHGYRVLGAHRGAYEGGKQGGQPQQGLERECGRRKAFHGATPSVLAEGSRSRTAHLLVVAKLVLGPVSNSHAIREAVLVVGDPDAVGPVAHPCLHVRVPCHLAEASCPQRNAATPAVGAQKSQNPLSTRARLGEVSLAVTCSLTAFLVGGGESTPKDPGLPAPPLCLLLRRYGRSSALWPAGGRESQRQRFSVTLSHEHLLDHFKRVHDGALALMLLTLDSDQCCNQSRGRWMDQERMAHAASWDSRGGTARDLQRGHGMLLWGYAGERGDGTL